MDQFDNGSKFPFILVEIHWSSIVRSIQATPPDKDFSFVSWYKDTHPSDRVLSQKMKLNTRLLQII